MGDGSFPPSIGNLAPDLRPLSDPIVYIAGPADDDACSPGA